MKKSGLTGKLLVVILICLGFVVMTMSAFAAKDYSATIRTVYAQLLSDRGYSYDGWCGQYVLDQLNANGIGYVTNGGSCDGNKIYYSMVDGAKTSGGYTQVKFGGNNALYDIVNRYGSTVENIVVSFTHQYGYSDSNPGAGHTNFIYGMVDGNIYFSESFTGYGYAEGAPQVLSIEQYMARYNTNYGNIIGAVVYTGIYKVYFDANGGSCVSEFQYIEYGKKYGPMPAATREGFTWLGWFTSPAVGENINENSIHSVQSDITIYSHWGTSVSFNANGGIDAPGTQWKVYGTYLDITDQQPQRAGYQFINWNTKADGSGESVRAGGRWWGDENTVLYAQWKQDRHMKSPDFTLPASLKTIEKGAFEGLGMTVVRCPEGLEEIGADAFRDCSGLVEIYIPGSVTFIDGGAFDGCAEGLTIFGRAGSVAQACAELNGLEFVAAEE